MQWCKKSGEQSHRRGEGRSPPAPNHIRGIREGFLERVGFPQEKSALYPSAKCRAAQSWAWPGATIITAHSRRTKRGSSCEWKSPIDLFTQKKAFRPQVTKQREDSWRVRGGAGRRGVTVWWEERLGIRNGLHVALNVIYEQKSQLTESDQSHHSYHWKWLNTCGFVPTPWAEPLRACGWQPGWEKVLLLHKFTQFNYVMCT